LRLRQRDGGGPGDEDTGKRAHRPDGSNNRASRMDRRIAGVHRHAAAGFVTGVAVS
jgi:hypothetical protein